MARFSPRILALCVLAIAAFLPSSHCQDTTGRQDGMEEVIIYDTTDADAVEFQCEPLDDTSPFNPRCNLNPVTCENWLCSGSASLTYCDSEFFVPGRTSDKYQVFNCTDDNTARCDSECSCVTGTYVGSGSQATFEPDGGNCTIVDVIDGSLAPYPTEAPTMGENGTTIAPTPSVTIAPSTSAPSMGTTTVPPTSSADTVKVFSVFVLTTSALLLSH